MTTNLGISVNRGRGATPEELAHRFANKAIVVADTAPPQVRDQVNDFRARLERIMVNLAREAAFNERATIYNAIKDAGQSDLAQAIMRI